MSPDYKIIGQRIKQARKNKGYSQIDLAEKLEISDVYISRIERGQAKVNLKRLTEICELLEISLTETITGTVQGSKQYLEKELAEIIGKCSPKKQMLIYEIARIISTGKMG